MLKAGSTASKLLDTWFINNVGLNTGFKTHAFNKSNSAEAVLA